MNKFDKYKQVVKSLDELYLSKKMIDEGSRFNVIITSSCTFISYNTEQLLFVDIVDKESNFKDILELCKIRYENNINELIKFKITNDNNKTK